MLLRPPGTLQISKRPELHTSLLRFPQDFTHLPTKPTATFPSLQRPQRHSNHRMRDAEPKKSCLDFITEAVMASENKMQLSPQLKST